MDSKSDKLTRDPTPENEACEKKKRKGRIYKNTHFIFNNEE